jgi:hypothetical protein
MSLLVLMVMLTSKDDHNLFLPYFSVRPATGTVRCEPPAN